MNKDIFTDVTNRIITIGGTGTTIVSGGNVKISGNIQADQDETKMIFTEVANNDIIVGATGDGSGSSPASTECIGTRPGVIQTCSGSPSWATHDDERVLTPIISGAQNCITNTNYASSGNPLRDVDLKNVCATELGCFIEINGKTAHPFRAPTDDQSLSGGIPLLQSEGVETLSSDSNCANDHVDFYMSKSSCTSQKNTFGISCCSSENKCGAGEGKCINDNDCYSNLECGAGKCSWGGAGDKCCYLPDGETFVPNALKDWNCGITRQDCLKRCAQNGKWIFFFCFRKVFTFEKLKINEK